MAKLGSCFLIVRNGASIKQVNGASGLPITRIETISNCVVDRNKFGYADIYDAGKYEEFLLRDQDILMSHINSEKHLGKVAIYHQNNDEKIIHGMNLLMLRANPEIVFPQYIAYYFESPFFKRQIVSITKKSVNQASFTVTALKELTVPIVSLDKQRKIAAVLDKVSELIAKRRAQLDKLDLLVKARFVEMFGECKTNPKNWEVCNLEDIAQVGSSKRVFVEELKESGVPFYRGTEIGALAEGKKIEPELFITEEHYEKLCQATGKPQIGDLLMPSICPDGRIWVVDSEEPFYFKDGRVLWVHQISANFNPVFLLYTLKDRIMTDYSSIASGTTFAELKIFSLKKCGVFNVPIQLQSQFAEFVVQIERLKDSISHSLEKLETMKKALMQEYFG